MTQRHLQEFIKQNVVTEGWQLAFSDLSKTQLNKLISLAKAVLDAPSKESKTKATIKGLFMVITDLVNTAQEEDSWEDVWDEFWALSSTFTEH